MKKIFALALAVALLAGITSGCAKTPKDDAIITDVLVIGGGGAGLVTAITAAEEGANVILIEKMPMLGGNTITSATGLTASDTALHAAAGIPFTVEDHIQRTMTTGKGLPNEALVRILAEQSNAALEWLMSLGLEYKLNEAEPWWIVPVEGHFGALYTQAIVAEANKLSNLEIRLETRGTELIIENNVVVGAKVVGKDGKEVTIRAKAVVLATGGFGNATDLIGEYVPRWAGSHNVMSTAGPTGDGFRMALAAGAGTVDMEYHQMRPLGRSGYWIRESVISQEFGGILINKEGQRFAAETMAPWDLTAEILKQTDRVGYIIFDEFIFGTSNGRNAVNRGAMLKADTLEELIAALELDVDVVMATIAEFNEGVDEFNRTTAGQIGEGPFYGVQVLPSSHYTMAGVTFNANAQAITASGDVIEGLYIVGELGGGLYGAGRVAGNNTTENVVFGKIAGKHAAARR